MAAFFLQLNEDHTVQVLGGKQIEDTRGGSDDHEAYDGKGQLRAKRWEEQGGKTQNQVSLSSCCCCFQLLQYLWQRQENNNVDTKPILDVTATAHVPTVQSIS